MIKTRYFKDFEVNGLELVAEIDTFINDTGNYIPWVKVDIEYPEGYDFKTHPIDLKDLPYFLIPGPEAGHKVHIVRPEDPKDAVVRKEVQAIYNEYFLRPNNYL